MVFAYDAAFFSHTECGLQAIIDHFWTACQDFGLIITITKTEVLAIATHSEPTILFTNQALTSMDFFKCLGSTVAFFSSWTATGMLT